MYIYVYIYIYIQYEDAHAETCPPIPGRLDCADFFSIKQKQRAKQPAGVALVWHRHDTGVYVYCGKQGFKKKRRRGGTVLVFPTVYQGWGIDPRPSPVSITN